MAGRYASDFREGAVCHDHTDPDTGLRVQVGRGFAAFTAYVGVRADHTLAGLEELKFKCHWGINWTGWGDGPETGLRAKDWFWWGWDYMHGRDGLALPDSMTQVEDDELRRLLTRHFGPPPGEAAGPLARKHWTLEEVIEDTQDVLFELKDALRASKDLSSLLMPYATR